MVGIIARIPFVAAVGVAVRRGIGTKEQRASMAKTTLRVRIIPAFELPQENCESEKKSLVGVWKESLHVVENSPGGDPARVPFPETLQGWRPDC